MFVYEYSRKDVYSVDPVDFKYEASGDEIGEYFGASITVCDFNGDGYDDIIVGSPMYSKIAADAGRVYVFISNGKVSITYNLQLGIRMIINVFFFKDNFKRRVLAEPTEANSRFGSSISVIGDLNSDGCDDIVIGAPYWDAEGRGAVFIYLGTRQSKDEANTLQYYRRIIAYDVDKNLRGFGISISKGFDIDNNYINGKVFV